jgi:hypothetical protein
MQALSNMTKIISYLFLRFDALKGQQIIAQGFDEGVSPWVYKQEIKSSAQK